METTVTMQIIVLRVSNHYSTRAVPGDGNSYSEKPIEEERGEARVGEGKRGKAKLGREKRGGEKERRNKRG